MASSVRLMLYLPVFISKRSFSFNDFRVSAPYSFTGFYFVFLDIFLIFFEVEHQPDTQPFSSSLCRFGFINFFTINSKSRTL